MSRHDFLSASLKCPQLGTVEDNVILLFLRYGEREQSFHIGDDLDNLIEGYDNTWVKTDYVCQSCSAGEERDGVNVIPVSGQRRHDAYVKIENSRLVAISLDQPKNYVEMD